MSNLLDLFKTLRGTSQSDELSKLINKCAQSEDIYAQNLVDNPNILEQVLLNHDIVPIRDSKTESSIIGVGSYGTVLRGTFNGNTVAVKIVKPDSREPGIWEKILKINFLPEELKHVPTIYGIFNGWVERPGGTWKLGVEPKIVPMRMSEPNTWHYKIIVMEELSPVSNKLEEILVGEHNYIDEIIKNDAHVNALAQAILNKTSIFEDIPNPADMREILNRISQSIKQVNVPKELGSDIDTHRGLISRVIFDVVKEELSSRSMEPDYNDGFQISRIVFNYLAGGGAFPQEWYDFEEVEPYWGKLPETQGLVSVLKKLQQAGIIYTDIKPDNLMMDPQTGDLVIIDVGMYEDDMENSAQDGFVARNLDYGDRQEMLVDRLKKLHNNLNKYKLHKSADLTLKLIKRAQEGDWNVEQEERMLEPERVEQEEVAWQQQQEKGEEQRIDKERRMQSENLGWKQTSEISPDDPRISRHFAWLDMGEALKHILLRDFYQTPEYRKMNDAVRGFEPDESLTEDDLTKLVSDAAKSALILFIRFNLGMLDRLVQNYGNKIPEHIGTGSWGDVWKLGTGQAFKITELDPAVVYEMELTTIYSNVSGADTENMIHAYGKFKGHAPANWIIMEKFKDLNELEREYNVRRDIIYDIVMEAYRFVTDLIIRGRIGREKIPWANEYRTRIIKDDNEIQEKGKAAYFLENTDANLKENMSSSAKLIESILRYTVKTQIEKVEDKINPSPDWLESLIEQQMIKYMTGRRDLHGGNIGLRELGDNKYFIYFDA